MYQNTKGLVEAIESATQGLPCHIEVCKGAVTVETVICVSPADAAEYIETMDGPIASLGMFRPVDDEGGEVIRYDVRAQLNGGADSDAETMYEQYAKARDCAQRVVGGVLSPLGMLDAAQSYRDAFDAILVQSSTVAALDAQAKCAEWYEVRFD